MTNIEEYNKNIFEKIKHIDIEGNEYWLARELQKILEYSTWQKFLPIIEKAKESCINSNFNVLDHFNQSVKMISIGNGGQRRKFDYKLSRYACYLITQNGNPKKQVIALAQTYFAYQTRKMELLESEDKKRLDIRKKVKNGNLNLNKTAVKSGVKNLGEFHNAGYKGLYNGETADDIFKRKGLKYREDILDNMGSIELADNLFRIAQTEDKLKKEKINNEYTANSIHYEIGRKVRKAIEDMGGTMPEDLPKPDKPIKKINNVK